jgi:hypothetical protein
MNRQNWLAMTTEAPTRRQLVAGAVAFAGCAARPIRVWAGAEDGISHTAESIHQEPVFQASRKRVYEALTDARQFDKIGQLSGAMQSGMALGKKPTEIGPKWVAHSHFSVATSLVAKLSLSRTNGSSKRGVWWIGILVSTRL